ncbi:MAG TPA: hypothetical protein VKE94_13120, partial [Gemmataceae bacterium]|nr:hypothetical protein [Gemmataceae bacterium]
MVANDEGSPKVDFMFALRELQGIWFRLHAVAFVGSLVRATVDRSDVDRVLRQPPDDVIIDNPSLLGGNVALRNAALVRHDEQNKTTEPAQSRKCLREETDFRGVPKKSGVFDQGAIAIKEDSWLLHPRGSPTRAQTKPANLVIMLTGRSAYHGLP